MKKTFLIVSIFVAVLILWGTGVGPRQSMRATVGKSVPSLEIAEADRTIALDEMRGRYVLLSFWDSADAPSREAVNNYSEWLRKHPTADVDLVAVNFDDSPALFRELVKRDNMNLDDHYNVSGRQADVIRRTFALGNADYGTLLIDPSGRIIADNPTPDALNRLVSSPLAVNRP